MSLRQELNPEVITLLALSHSAHLNLWSAVHRLYYSQSKHCLNHVVLRSFNVNIGHSKVFLAFWIVKMWWNAPNGSHQVQVKSLHKHFCKNPNHKERCWKPRKWIRTPSSLEKIYILPKSKSLVWYDISARHQHTHWNCYSIIGIATVVLWDTHAISNIAKYWSNKKKNHQILSCTIV